MKTLSAFALTKYPSGIKFRLIEPRNPRGSKLREE